jgi:putative transposase
MTMQAIYQAAGTSRQAFSDWRKPSKQAERRLARAEVVQMAKQVRQDSLLGSGVRVVYAFIRKKRPELSEKLVGWGKHAFENACFEGGLRIESRRFVPKTTVRGDFVFPNRIEGATIDEIDQVWVSDITYLFGNDGKLLGYATTIIDLFSRRLLGLAFSKTMHAAQTSLPALRQALAVRQKKSLFGLFFHSDAGKQFIEKSFIQLLRSNQIQSSMAVDCYENAFAESFNDLLKNHLMHDQILNSFQQLEKLRSTILRAYNYNRPHGSIQHLTPVEFENQMLLLQPFQRTPLIIKKVNRNWTTS